MVIRIDRRTVADLTAARTRASSERLLRWPLGLLLACVALTPAPALATNTASKVAGGYDHTCVLTAAGGVKCWGNNLNGQLGDGTTTDRLAPTDVVGLTSGVASVATGDFYTCALTTAGGIKCWGQNSTGQLGDGTTTDRSTPVDVTGLTSGVVAVATGWGHTCAVTGSGGVKCWGDNFYGEIGDGTTTGRLTPTDVAGLTAGVVGVAAGTQHTCAVMAGGGVKCWGANPFGQVGDGTQTNRSTPVDVVGLTIGAVSMAAGRYHNCALTTAGGVKCWGNGGDGRLGDGTTANRLTPVDVTGLTTGVTAVAPMQASTDHSCALTVTGGVKCWGRNDYGEVGDGSRADRLTPTDVLGLTSGVTAVAAGSSHTCAVTSGRGVTCWGDNSAGQVGDGTRSAFRPATDVLGLTSVASVTGGSGQTCVATTGGSAMCWGSNSNGQLGNGTSAGGPTPGPVSGLAAGVAAVHAGSVHTCALVSGGVKCWGSNLSGQLGNGTTTGSLTPVDVTGLTSGAAAVATGSSHSCALTSVGGAKCWGSNTSGQLGDGTTTNRLTPVDVTGLTSGVAAVAAGSSHSCAVMTGGGVKCWGSNSSGRLGDGTTTNRLTPVDVSGLTSGVASVAPGSSHTCALTTNGGVKCWGQNFFGQLGDGTSTTRLTPADVPGLVSGVLDLASGIAAFTCAVTAAGSVKCWGYNLYGQIGNGRKSFSEATPQDVVGLSSGVVSVGVGTDHACAVTAGANVKCWGSNRIDQLGDPTFVTRLLPVSVPGFRRGAPGDFDGDAKTDITVFRPSNGTWYQLRSSTGGADAIPWGLSGDTPLPSDYDGDGIADAAVFRPSSGIWYVLQSSTGTAVAVQWGLGNDMPVPADYDGDGRTDVAVYRPSTGTWFIIQSQTGTASAIGWGLPGDVPVPGDFDGDGKADPTLFRPSTGVWYAFLSATGTARGVPWGQLGDLPLAADYDGDGLADPTVFRPDTGMWYELRSATATGHGVSWGQNGDVPLAGDYDGDGRADPTVFRPSTGTWYQLRSTTGTGYGVEWGVTGDRPM